MLSEAIMRNGITKTGGDFTVLTQDLDRFILAYVLDPSQI